MKKVLLPLISILSIVIVFVIGAVVLNAMKHAADLRLVKSVYEDAEDCERIQGEFVKTDDSNKVYGALKVFIGGEHVGYVYLTETFGRQAGLKIATAIDAGKKTIKGIRVIDNNETPKYYSKVTGSPTFFKFFNGRSLSLNKPLLTIPAISGATYSRNGIEKGVQLARKQFAKDINWDLPVAVEVKSSTQDLKTLNLTYVIGYENEEYTVVLDKNYEIIDQGTVPENLLDQVKTAIANNPMKFMVKDATLTDNVYTITVNGTGAVAAGSKALNAILTYDTTAAKFTSFNVTVHSETPEYGETIIPSYPNELVNNPAAQPISEVTQTSNALKTILSLAQQYVNEVNK